MYWLKYLRNTLKMIDPKFSETINQTYYQGAKTSEFFKNQIKTAATLDSKL